MTERFQRLLEDAKRFHADCTALTMEADMLQRRAKFSAEDMADMVYLMKKTEPLVSDCKAALNNVMETMQNIAALAFLCRPENVANPQNVHINGKLCKAEMRVRVHATIPSQKKDPEAYATMMKSFGVGETAIGNDLVRPHYPKICDMLTDLAAEGKPAPAGLDKTYPRYWLTCRSKKD